MVDVASALAELAHRDDYARPEVDDSLELVLEDARHPVVERLAAAGRFVPNDVVLDALAGRRRPSASRLWLVTGPEHGRQIDVHAAGRARRDPRADGLVRAGAARARSASSIACSRASARATTSSRGESTFMVEMKETANILRRATRRSLVVLDEIGRGTSTYDGLAIAWAVAEHLHDVVGCRALFATHYHELTELAATLRRLRELERHARASTTATIVFLHKLQRGAASRSYGVACARLAGLPEPVLARARAILEDLERHHHEPRRPQLDLFAPTSSTPAEHPALATLRSVDVDRLTPLDALQLIASLKKQLPQ